MGGRKSTPAAQAPPTEGADAPFWPAAVGLFVAALVVRLWHVWQLKQSPFGSVLLGDAAGYDAWARRIAAGDWLGQGVFYQAPLYPYFLGGVYAVFGPHLIAVRVVQSLLGAVGVVLLALAARQLFGRNAGIAAGSLLAFYSPALFFDGLIQKASLDLMLTCSLLWAVTLIVDRPTACRALAAGLIVGCLALTRENALVFAPLLFAWLLFRREQRGSDAAVFALGLALVLAPVVARNFAVSGEVHLTTSQFGPNLYIGNHQGATGTYMPLRRGRGNVRFEQDDATRMAEEAIGRPLGPGQVSSYWTSRALDWIVGHPVEWLELSLKKMRLAWNVVEATDTEDLYSHAERSLPLRICDAFMNFGVLAPLGLFGMWLTRDRWRELWILHAMVVVYLLSVVLFYVVARYRFPLAPFLVLFAGGGLARFPVWFRQASRMERSRGFAVLATVAVTSNWPMQSAIAMKSLTRYNLGDALRSAGRSDEAIEQFRAALELHPANSAAASNLGALMAAKGDHDEAVRLYESALAADPENTAAHDNLGQEQAARGQLEEAIASFRRSIAIDPRGSGAHHNLGTALAASGRTDEAIREFEEAVRSEPENAGAHNNLGILLASSGRLEEGVEHFRAALRARPDFAEAAANLARAEEELRKERRQ